MERGATATALCSRSNSEYSNRPPVDVSVDDHAPTLLPPNLAAARAARLALAISSGSSSFAMTWVPSHAGASASRAITFDVWKAMPAAAAAGTPRKKCLHMRKCKWVTVVRVTGRWPAENSAQGGHDTAVPLSAWSSGQAQDRPRQHAAETCSVCQPHREGRHAMLAGARATGSVCCHL